MCSKMLAVCVSVDSHAEPSEEDPARWLFGDPFFLHPLARHGSGLAHGSKGGDAED